jgi:NADPH:quinone reductase-like Zn-dependent oxidoreductase
MQAVVIDESTPARSLRVQTVPDPVPGPADLLVAVMAAGVNRADLRRASIHFAASTDKGLPIAGLEFAGEVLAFGDQVSGFAVGDRVMAMANGAFAERATVDHRLATHVPAAMTWQQAAATPVAFITAHNALMTAGGMKAGDTVLVQAASSGVGIATVQIARLLGASMVLGTAGSHEKLERLSALGCDVAIDYRGEDLVGTVRTATGLRGADVIVDFAGGAMVQKNIDAARIGGRIVCAGRVGGIEASINIDEFSRKQLWMVGVTNRTRSAEERFAVVRAFALDLLPALDSGRLVPVIDRTYALEDAEAAQDFMQTNRHFGKIVLVAGPQ